MQVQVINNQYHQNYGNKFKLSPKTIKVIETSTGLTYEEITRSSINEATKLMKERGTLKEPSKLTTWFSKKYKELGEKLGLLKKQPNIYTDIH